MFIQGADYTTQAMVLNHPVWNDCGNLRQCPWNVISGPATHISTDLHWVAYLYLW